MNQKHSKFDTLYVSSDDMEILTRLVELNDVSVEELEIDIDGETVSITSDDGNIVIR